MAAGVGRVMTSADGEAWDEIPLVGPAELRAIHATGGAYVGVGDLDALWRSEDLVDWTLQSSRGGPALNGFTSSP